MICLQSATCPNEVSCVTVESARSDRKWNHWDEPPTTPQSIRYRLARLNPALLSRISESLIDWHCCDSNIRIIILGWSSEQHTEPRPSFRSDYRHFPPDSLWFEQLFVINSVGVGIINWKIREYVLIIAGAWGHFSMFPQPPFPQPRSDRVRNLVTATDASPGRPAFVIYKNPRPSLCLQHRTRHHPQHLITAYLDHLLISYISYTLIYSHILGI